MNKLTTIALTLSLAACGGDGEAGAVRSFVEGYPSMSDSEHYEALKRLSGSDHLFISSFNFVAGDVYRKACRTNDKLIVNIQGQMQDCAQLRASYEDAIRSGFTSAERIGTEVEGQRQKILNHLKCYAGEIDQGTCAAYGAAGKTYGDVTASNGQKIVNPDLCVVGVDPYCFK